MQFQNEEDLRDFFERQETSSTCRLHAINNALGRSVISKKKFFAYCDEFDMKNHCKGSRQFFFIHADDNIISFILNKLHLHSSYYPPDNPPPISENSCDDIVAIIIFDNEHIWSNKKYGNIWYDLDSLSEKPEPIPFRRIFARRGFGWIIVRTLPEHLSNDEIQITSNPTNEKPDHTVTNYSPESKTHRYSLEDETVPDNLYLNLKRNGSNRFEALYDIEEDM
ncbi:hypothetical protein I4U23_015358 [Adineta vaga]|nr:hypothetical protein I4U23_015358 [Adineta vaga]